MSHATITHSARHDVRTRLLQPMRRLVRRLAATVLALTAGVAAPGAFASDAAFLAPPARANAPAAVLAAPDLWVEQSFVASDFADFQAVKVARLDDGTIITLATATKGTLINSRTQFILAKRNAFKYWSEWLWGEVPDPYNVGERRFIVYPNDQPGASPIRDVVDMKVYKNRIYVLMSAETLAGTWAPLVRCFTATGADCGWRSNVFSLDSADTAQHAVGFDIHGDQMVILARNRAGFRVARWTVKPDGSLTHVGNTTFDAPHGNGRAEPVAIAAKPQFGVTFYDGYYVLYTRKISSDSASADRDPCVFSVDANDKPGTDLDSGSRYICRSFDEAESSRDDRAVAFTPRAVRNPLTGFTHTSIEVVVQVARKSRDGIGIWKITSGRDDANFGKIGGGAGDIARGLGRIVYGGCGPVTTGGANQGSGCGGQYATGTLAHRPRATSGFAGELVAVGDVRWHAQFPGTGTSDSPFFARFDRDTGALLQQATFRESSRDGDQNFSSVVALDNRRLVALGSIRATVLNERVWAQLTTFLTNQREDAIFENGFDPIPM